MKQRPPAEYDLRCLDCAWSKRVDESKCAEVMARHERTHRRHRTWRMAVIPYTPPSGKAT